MSVRNARGVCRHHMQLLHVARVDLCKRTIARIRVITRRQRPLPVGDRRDEMDSLLRSGNVIGHPVRRVALALRDCHSAPAACDNPRRASACPSRSCSHGSHPVPLHLLQRVQIGSDVLRLLIAQSKVRHSCTRFDPGRVAKPAHEILRCIRQLSRDHRPTAKEIEWRPHHSPRCIDPRYRVA